MKAVEKGNDDANSAGDGDSEDHGHCYPQQWTMLGPRSMGDDWNPLWDETAAQLAPSLEALQRKGEERKSERQRSGGGAGGAKRDGVGGDSRGYCCNGSSVLGYLFASLGRDCGRFLRGLHALRVSWGTYQDAMCRRDLDEWHCNAHANNMVLLNEADGMACESPLAYLDLDMAFDEATFVDTNTTPAAAGAAEGGGAAEMPGGRGGGVSGGGGGGGGEAGGGGRTASATVGAPKDKLLLRESVNFMEVLAGGDSSNGVPRVAKSEVDAQSPVLRAAKSALYDTLLLNFVKAYNDTGGGSDSSDSTTIGQQQQPFSVSKGEFASLNLRRGTTSR